MASGVVAGFVAESAVRQFRVLCEISYPFREINGDFVD